MSNNQSDLAFPESELETENIDKTLDNCLNDCDDGELYIEKVRQESLTYDDGVLKDASFNVSNGFGIRAVKGEKTGFAHSSQLTLKSLKTLSNSMKLIKEGRNNLSYRGPVKTNMDLYSTSDPTSENDFKEKVNLLTKIDNYARSQDNRIKQVTANVSGSFKKVLPNFDNSS